MGRPVRTPKLLRPNLPTLIEASPEFNRSSSRLSIQSCQLSIPDLPASVLVPPDVGVQLQSWYRQQQKLNENQEQNFYDYPITEYPSTDGELCDMPMLENIRSSSRASACSVKFYSDPESKEPSYKHQTKVVKNKRRSKDRERHEIFEKKKTTKDIEMKDIQEEAFQTQGDMFADEKTGTMQRQKINKTTENIPEMAGCWECKKCTLQNLLKEEVCQACGGSRLNSYLEMDKDPLMEEVEYVNPNLLPDGQWICDICTLQNEANKYVCEACNSKNPYNEKPCKEAPVEQEKKDVKQILHKIVRYFGIVCLASVIFYLAFNVLIGVLNGAISLGKMISSVHLSNHLNLTERGRDDFDDTLDDEDIHFFTALQFWGLNPILLGILTPIFLLVIMRG